MKKQVFLLSTICTALLLVPTVSYAIIPVMQFGSLPYRTINVDGDPCDWEDLPPLVVDGDGDSPPNEDIVTVYGANDEDYVYFLMEFNELRFFNGTINENGYTVCRFFIDIIPGGDSTNKDADFRIGFKTHIVLTETLIPTEVAVLEYYEPTSWLLSDCSDVQGETMGRFVEVAVKWDCIGGKNCFNCFFTASAVANTDWAPDQDAEYVMIGCCPSGKPGPVGGVILPTNNAAIKLVALPGIIFIVLFLRSRELVIPK